MSEQSPPPPPRDNVVDVDVDEENPNNDDDNDDAVDYDDFYFDVLGEENLPMEFDDVYAELNAQLEDLNNSDDNDDDDNEYEDYDENIEDDRVVEAAREVARELAVNLDIFNNYHQINSINEESSNNNNNNENENESNSTNQTNYDLSLPVEHSYLGNLNSVQSGQSRHLFTPGSIINLKTLYLNGIFLFPGQEIPLTFKHLVTRSFIDNIISSKQLIFGIRVGFFDDRLGTTAEIRSFSFSEGQVSVKIQGRQRFMILDDNNSSLGLYELKVRILHELDLCDFYRPLIQSEKRLPKTITSFLTPYPQKALNQYDSHFLMEKLKSILMKIFESRIKNYEFNFPIDPAAFSYFVLMTIPFDDKIKARLLKIDCVNLRLRLEYSLLDANFKFICCTCCLDICDRDSFLVMSKLGVAGTFVNSYGHLHELYTFSLVFENTIQPVSTYTEDYSWFPNYGWLIINCSRCHSHLGWEFQTKKPKIYPRKFYALTKSSIRLAWTLDSKLPGFIYKFFETEGLERDILDYNEVFRNGVPEVDF